MPALSFGIGCNQFCAFTSGRTRGVWRLIQMEKLVLRDSLSRIQSIIGFLLLLLLWLLLICLFCSFNHKAKKNLSSFSPLRYRQEPPARKLIYILFKVEDKTNQKSWR